VCVCIDSVCVSIVCVCIDSVCIALCASQVGPELVQELVDTLQAEVTRKCVLLRPTASYCILLRLIASCCVLLHLVASYGILLRLIASCCVLLYPVALLHLPTPQRTHARTYAHARRHTYARTHALAHTHTHTHTHTDAQAAEGAERRLQSGAPAARHGCMRALRLGYDSDI
jgi:hypothetical protein